MKYVNVVIDNSSDSTDSLFTYRSVSDDINIGDKVRVTFGAGNRAKDAYVFEIVDSADGNIKNIKDIGDIDKSASLDPETVSLCKWMKERYFCRYIDAVKCFTPAGSVSKKGRERNPNKDAETDLVPAPELTREQELAMDAVRPHIDAGRHKAVLIHGVTSSGKTEIYMRTIAGVLEKGKTAIMLVPEISLTKQTIDRFIGRFGAEKIAVLHSRLTLGERYDEWMRAKRGDVSIVIGARSGIFAPLSNLGAIIVDEEHETTYKSDMTPKYDTIEVAIRRAEDAGAVVLLGSATPSAGSYYKALQGIYEKVVLKERYNLMPLPSVEIMDMRDELRNGNKSIFSVRLYDEISSCLKTGRQVILFLNRRGYASFISCRSCGYVMKCRNCGVSLTYHKDIGKAVCHYCGLSEKPPAACPDCGGKYIRHFGTGTEKVEELAKVIFPEASIERLDLDTARKKGSIDRILSDFKKRKTDILIGTQIVAKGLDFENVGLVGIVAADISLNIPDFRSAERTFQLITQASGRAGRGDKAGKVIIQSYTPGHYAITAAAANDYEGFYRNEIMVRKQLFYPPFSQIIQIMVMGDGESETGRITSDIAAALRKKAGSAGAPNVLGPHPAAISKINGKYRFQILIKADADHAEIFEDYIRRLKGRLHDSKKTDLLISVDRNPYSLV